MIQDKEDKPMFVNREPAEMTTEYRSWLSELKKRYRKAQVRAVVKVNGEMLNFYWGLGRDICAMSKNAKYGDGLLKNITLDLQSEFPGDTGLSLSNIKAARRWYKTYSQWIAKSQQPVDLFGQQSDEGILSMPNGATYYPDLIFYHIPTHRYVVCELKVVPFEPEFAGKLNFYVSAVDHLLRGKDDNKTIGLLICRSKNDTIVEWSFEGIERPIGVAEYEKEIKQLIDNLPTSKQISDNI